MRPDALVITAARPSEIGAAARLAADAMIGLPENRAVFRDRVDRLEAAFHHVFRQGPGELLLAWEDPDRSEESLRGLMRLVPWPLCKPRGLGQLLEIPRLLFTLRGALGRALTLHGAWAEREPAEPHVHLDPLAVAKDHQDRGVGARLMAEYCARLDRDGVPGYLETAALGNVQFYERFGFVVRDEVEALGVRTRLMWRAPPVEAREIVES